MRVLTIQSEASEVDAAIGTMGAQLIEAVPARHEDAVARLRDEDFDLVTIEISRHMPAAEVVQRMRLAKLRTPVLLVSPPDRLVEVVRALSAGADDYLTLPVEREVLIKRLFAMNREHAARVRPVLRVGKLRIDVERRTLQANGEPVHLTGKEFQMLELLASRAGTTVTKGEFLDHLYGGVYEPVMKIIDVFICKLRKKIIAATGQSYIETIWGRGYVMRDVEAVADEGKRSAA